MIVSCRECASLWLVNGQLPECYSYADGVKERRCHFVPGVRQCVYITENPVRELEQGTPVFAVQRAEGLERTPRFRWGD